jgi:hypothetical protein
MTNTVYVIAPSAEQAAQISFAGDPGDSYTTYDGARERLFFMEKEYLKVLDAKYRPQWKLWEVTITTEAKEATR